MDFLTKDKHSNTGYFLLEWESGSNAISLFQEKSGEWYSVYEGNLNQISQSGLSNGIYRYSLCPEKTVLPDAKICKYTTVRVEHFTPFQTIASLSFGSVLFLSIILALLLFHKKVIGS